MTPQVLEDIYDIKPPLDWPGIHLGLIAILILAAIFVSAILWWIHKQNKAKGNIVPQKTIWEVAYQQLEELEREDLLSKGKFKEYYSRLCDIIRHYIEERFHIRTCEMTTEEFLNFLRISPILSDQQKMILQDFLNSCDLVKFAKHVPPASEGGKVFEITKKFIEETK